MAADPQPAPLHSSSEKPKLPAETAGSKPQPAAKDDLKTLPLAEVQKRLNSSANGLTQAEAAQRLAKDGPNEIAEKKTNGFLKFLGYFWGPIPWMIEAAVILSGIVKHWPDFFIILVLLILGGTCGGQCDRGFESEACHQDTGEARWQVGNTAGARAGAGRCHSIAPRRYSSRGR
jgi:magnesium-transporting ATPase (P-type)